MIYPYVTIKAAATPSGPGRPPAVARESSDVAGQADLRTTLARSMMVMPVMWNALLKTGGKHFCIVFSVAIPGSQYLK